MNNDLSDLLGNNSNLKVKPNVKPNVKTNNSNYSNLLGESIFGNNNKNGAQNTVEYAKNTISNTKESFDKLSTTSKVLLLFGILLILFIIGLIIKYYRDQRLKEQFAHQPIFMTGIENNDPHNSQKIYRYIDPNTGKATPYIPGYNFNETNGIQYTFSFWMFIDGKKWNYRFGEWKHIFHRGTAPPTTDQGENSQIVKMTNQLPGFWISPKENTLNCVITTRKNEERLTLEDIPINKWMNIVVTINNTSVALYKDGLLHKTINLLDTVNSTKDAVYVNYFGGFGGNMAYLQFFDRVLTPEEIMRLYQEYKVNIDKYINHMFKNELNRMKLPVRLTEPKCNYLDYIKQENDKSAIREKIIGIYEILCKNTKDKTATQCKTDISEFKKFLDGIPAPDLKKILDNIVKSVSPIDENAYQYINLNNKKDRTYLTKEEYQKIKNIVS